MISLAEELTLLAIEDDGTIAYTAGQTGFGMALIAACLVDLNSRGSIDADLDTLHVINPQPTGDATLDLVLSELAAQTELSVEQWVLKLANHVPKLVQLALSALLTRGILAQRDTRFLWVMKERRYPVIDGKEQKEAKLRILATLLGEDVPTPHDTVLVGLARAGGLLEGFLSSAEIQRLESRIGEVGGIDLIVRGAEAAIREDQAARARAVMLPMF